MLVVRLKRRAVLAGVAAALVAPSSAFAIVRWPEITVHKDPNCGCCGGWADHLKAAGFPVRIVDSTDLAGCHTAEMAGYIVEGHVPAPAIKRLLSEKPRANGLAVPGMPLGSPGMDGPPEIYEVILFGPAGQRSYGKFRGAERV
jgi:hypothetical protein